jgi:hypothetical protein
VKKPKLAQHTHEGVRTTGWEQAEILKTNQQQTQQQSAHIASTVNLISQPS